MLIFSSTWHDNSYYEQKEFWGNDLPAAEADRINTISSLIPNDVESILDAGCGDGILANQLNRKYKVVALDCANTPLQYVKTNKIRGDISNLPFHDKSFDIVISAEVLEHLPHGIYEDAIIEMQRVSKKYIIISVPNEGLQEFIKCNYCGCIFSLQ